MASPFPGMDPYLEQPGVWPGFHGQALAAIVAHLVLQATSAYVVQMKNNSSSFPPWMSSDNDTSRSGIVGTAPG